MKQKWALLFLIIAVVLIIDQGAKLWIINQLEIGQTLLPIPALHPYFQFTRTMNTGIAFGLGTGGSTFFLILSIIITCVLLFYYSRSAPDAFVQQLAFGMVIGGALGNIIDRIRVGHVIDFFHVFVPFMGISNVSNFADHAIVIGVGLLLVDSFMQEQRAQQTTETQQAIEPDDASGF